MEHHKGGVRSPKLGWVSAPSARYAAIVLWVLAAPVTAGAGDHPVGVDYYAVAAAKPLSYTPPRLLPPQIRLLNGKVDCVSCHTGLGLDTGELVMSNEHSALCLACHRM